MWFEFTDDHASQLIVVSGVNCHEAQFGPLVEKVSVHIDAVRFGKVFGDQLADLGEILGLFVKRVLEVAYPGNIFLEIGTWLFEVALASRSRRGIAAHYCRRCRVLSETRGCHCGNNNMNMRTSITRPQVESNIGVGLCLKICLGRANANSPGPQSIPRLL